MLIYSRKQFNAMTLKRFFGHELTLYYHSATEKFCVSSSTSVRKPKLACVSQVSKNVSTLKSLCNILLKGAKKIRRQYSRFDDEQTF